MLAKETTGLLWEKLLERLVAFKVNLENQMHLAVATSSMMNKGGRISLGQPKLFSRNCAM